jgi:outer membrane cobalamin receptor
MKHTLIFLALFFIAAQLKAQHKITYCGYVTDALSGEVLIGATVYEINSGKGCTTNEFGYYSITMQESTDAVLRASYVGYNPLASGIGSGTHNINFKLHPGIEIKEIKVGQLTNQITQNNNINVAKLYMHDVQKIPSLFGENDLIQAIQLMPGVQSGGEGKSQLYVRGGSPDQNLILLDDVPLYYVSHFGGFFSIFNTDAINNVELTKGGFPARYGSRLSSILDIRMKEGNLNAFEGKGSIGLLSSKVSVEGPIVPERASYIFSARKSVLPIMKMITKNLNNDFYDINAKLNFRINNNDRLYFSTYIGSDVVSINQYDQEKSNLLTYSNKTSWGNYMASLRWNHVFSPKLFSNFTLSSVKYQYRSNVFQKQDGLIQNIETKNLLTSGITDINANIDLNWYFSTAFKIRAGTKNTFHLFVPNNQKMHKTSSIGLKSDTEFYSKTNAIENALYVENEFKAYKFHGNIGARLTAYSVDEKTFLYAEPRISLVYNLSNWLNFDVSYAQMNQFMHLLSYSNAGFPNDYWMPATKDAVPEFSEQFSVGVNMCIENSGYAIAMVAYNKSMEELIAFKDGASLYGNFDQWEKLVETGGFGKSKGIELIFQKVKGRTNGWLSTTVSKTTRKFDNINNGHDFPFKYDRLLDISVVVNHQINDNVEFSAIWNYGTGYPVTLAMGKYQFDRFNELLVWGERNSHRMPNYHRLDIAVNFPYPIGKVDGEFSLSILNVYNRNNPYYYFYLNITGKKSELYQQGLIPFLPSFSYSFKF